MPLSCFFFRPAKVCRKRLTSGFNPLAGTGTRFLPERRTQGILAALGVGLFEEPRRTIASGSLLCLPEEGWDDIVEINSHPVALAQCREFLLQHPDVKIVEAEDTAGSAELISRKQLKGHAAICSKSAAPLYDMKVLEEGIETNKHNFTRFLVVADPWKADELRDRSHINKATIVFSLPHCEGSLSQVLSIFSFYNINLTKIQSLPII